MTSSHAAKTAIRERMARTGETYSTARKNLLQRPSQPPNPVAGSAQATMALALSHIPALRPLLEEGRHLIIAGRTGGGKTVSLNALLELPEAEAYVTPAKLGVQASLWPGMEPSNDLMGINTGSTGYLAFREEAGLRYPGQPTACTMHHLALERDDLQQVPPDTTVVLLQWFSITKKVEVFGVRRIGEIQSDRGWMSFRAALMDPSVRSEAEDIF